MSSKTCHVKPLLSHRHHVVWLHVFERLLEYVVVVRHFLQLLLLLLLLLGQSYFTERLRAHKSLTI